MRSLSLLAFAGLAVALATPAQAQGGTAESRTDSSANGTALNRTDLDQPLDTGSNGPMGSRPSVAPSDTDELTDSKTSGRHRKQSEDLSSSVSRVVNDQGGAVAPEPIIIYGGNPNGIQYNLARTLPLDDKVGGVGVAINGTFPNTSPKFLNAGTGLNYVDGAIAGGFDVGDGTTGIGGGFSWTTEAASSIVGVGVGDVKMNVNLTITAGGDILISLNGTQIDWQKCTDTCKNANIPSDGLGNPGITSGMPGGEVPGETNSTDSGKPEGNGDDDSVPSVGNTAEGPNPISGGNENAGPPSENLYGGPDDSDQSAPTESDMPVTNGGKTVTDGDGDKTVSGGIPKDNISSPKTPSPYISPPTNATAPAPNGEDELDQPHPNSQDEDCDKDNPKLTDDQEPKNDGQDKGNKDQGNPLSGPGEYHHSTTTTTTTYSDGEPTSTNGSTTYSGPGDKTTSNGPKDKDGGADKEPKDVNPYEDPKDNDKDGGADKEPKVVNPYEPKDNDKDGGADKEPKDVNPYEDPKDNDKDGGADKEPKVVNPYEPKDNDKDGGADKEPKDVNPYEDPKDNDKDGGADKEPKDVNPYEDPKDNDKDGGADKEPKVVNPYEPKDNDKDGGADNVHENPYGGSRKDSDEVDPQGNAHNDAEGLKKANPYSQQSSYDPQSKNTKDVNSSPVPTNQNSGHDKWTHPDKHQGWSSEQEAAPLRKRSFKKRFFGQRL